MGRKLSETFKMCLVKCFLEKITIIITNKKKNETECFITQKAIEFITKNFDGNLKQTLYVKS